MTTLFWFGQVCSLLGAACLAISTFGKKKKDLVRWQIADTVFNAGANLFLLSFSGVVVNAVSFIRNVLAFRNRLTVRITVGLCIVMAVIGICANNRGAIGLIPVAASVGYTIGMHRLKTAQSMRLLIAVNIAVWLVYDLTIRSYPIAVVDCIILGTTAVNLVKGRNGDTC